MPDKKHKSFRFSGVRGEHDYFMVATGIFILVVSFHFLRLWYRIDVRVGDYVVPNLISWIAVAVAGYMAWEGFKYSKKQ
ncbi:MAG: hypothetical protein WD712_00540 [Candidatus Spechtbacterales bacterium]